MNNCIEHKNKPNPNGYIRVRRNGERWLAHRLAYVLSKGKIIRGMEIDHICKNKKCINPDHLEMVTPTENKRRSNCPSGENFRKTHCIRGHEFNATNTYIHRGQRRCLICKKLGR